MTEREAFEAQAELHGLETFRMGDTEAYAAQPTRVAWALWQASRKQALSEAVTRAVIHSQYPIDCDFDRGYAKARKDAAEDIRELATKARTLKKEDTCS